MINKQVTSAAAAMHLAADCRLGQAKILRRERDTHAPPNRDEAANQIQAVEPYQRD